MAFEQQSIEIRPKAPGRAVADLGRCAARTVSLLARSRLHQPTDHVGRRLRFADGSSAPVYRETIVDRQPTKDPAVLVVSFQLRRVQRAELHAAFRLESVLNTVLFAGFPGFVSKLWLAHDGRGMYRGFYEWDGPQLAADYVRALWWALAVVSDRRSIRWIVVPGLRRDEVLAEPSLLDRVDRGDGHDWWRLVADPTVGP